jgi:AcrR family transcriptional regulator
MEVTLEYDQAMHPRRSPDGETLRDRKRRRTRDAIAASGLQLFLERGFHHTSVAQIAEAADVSPATVYRYFETKEGLLFANHDGEQELLCEAVVRHSHHGDPRAVMAAAVRDLASQMRPGEQQYDARIRVIASSPALMGTALRTRASWEAAAARQLAGAASREPEVADEVAAGAAVGALHAAVRDWYARKGSVSLSDCLSLALAALWPDLGVDDTPVPPWPVAPPRRLLNYLGDDDEPEDVVVGIETDRGPWVQALLATGYTVYAVNPLQAARYRERHRHLRGEKRPG